MPGHAISNDEIQNTKNICEMLESLIESHDVTFILTDSRESRWLPTLLCSVLGKVFFFYFYKKNSFHNLILISLLLIVL